MNVAFALLVLAAVASTVATGGDPAALGKAALDGATSAVQLVVALLGPIVLFLGLMGIVERAGGLAAMARAIRPLMRKLFPEIPADHPAMGAMVLNLSANALGLGNAATPFGLRAMAQLRQLSVSGDAATDAMCLFLAINTSGLSLVPGGVIATRAALGSHDAAAILPTTLVATACSTLTAVAAALLLRRFWAKAPVVADADRPDADHADAAAPAAVDLLDAAAPAAVDPLDAAATLTAAGAVEAEATGLRAWIPALSIAAGVVALVVAVAKGGPAVSDWILPGLITAMVGVGVLRRVPVYEAFLSAAREGIASVLGIVAPMVGVLAAIAMLRSSGAVDALVAVLGPWLAPLGVPAEVLPLALLRPLSGSGAFALCTELMQTHGPDSPIGLLASTLVGSTETTFYVLAVYFGAAGVTRPRWALAAGLCADTVGAIASVLAVRWLL